MNLDGRRLTEDQRMALLREEEDALGIQPLEYVSNEIISHRLQMHPPSPPPPPGATAEGSLTALDAGGPFEAGQVAHLGAV